jgi:hypothetical protein
MMVAVAVVLARGAHAQPAASGTPPGAPEAGPDVGSEIGSDMGSELGPEIGSDIADELAELGRLEGQRVRIVDQGTTPGRGHVPRYVIEDVAGEGAPVVGVVERRGQALWLVAEDGASYRLAGALARPRIAGPGYKIWALGAVTAGSAERILVARRIGVLAPPGGALRRAAHAGRSSRSRPGRRPGPADPSSPSRD